MEMTTLGENPQFTARTVTIYN